LLTNKDDNTILTEVKIVDGDLRKVTHLNGRPKPTIQNRSY